MVRGITYTDANMTRSGELCWKSMKENGVESVKVYHPDEVNEWFVKFNKPIFDSPRGCGYWIWKPFIINENINLLQDGDTLIYSDAGCEIISDVNEIIKVMDQDLFLFTSGHLQHEWCKMDVMEAILRGSTGLFVDNHLQVQASLIFIRVSDYTRRLAKEWLLWCQMPGLIDDSPSVLPNHPNFKEHRHDQAILSALAIRENITLHWWPDAIWFQNQRHRWPDDKYPPMVNHHRKRNNEW
jgi:hypothetical protein